jgi:hypothetical protein
MRHPWGSGPYDLSQIILTANEKDFLADLVIEGKMKSKDVAEHFNLNYNSLKYYTFRRRHSSRNYNCRGRSPSIDSISDRAIKSRLTRGRNRALVNLKSIIREEGFETFKRKQHHFINRDKRRKLYISYRSIDRYYDIYTDYYNRNLSR